MSWQDRPDVCTHCKADKIVKSVLRARLSIFANKLFRGSALRNANCLRALARVERYASLRVSILAEPLKSAENAHEASKTLFIKPSGLSIPVLRRRRPNPPPKNEDRIFSVRSQRMTWILHKPEAFIGKALKGEVIAMQLRALNNTAYESLRLALCGEN